MKISAAWLHTYNILINKILRNFLLKNNIIKSELHFKSIFKNQAGFSLIEIIVALGVMGIIALAFVTMTENQVKQMKQIETKQEAINIKNSLLRIFSSPSCCPVGSSGFSTVHYTVGTPSTVAFNQIYPSCEAASVSTPILDVANSNPQSLIHVTQISLIDIAPVTAGATNDFSANLLIKIDPATHGLGKIKPITLSAHVSY